MKIWNKKRFTTRLESGFTLAETLLATLILLMVSSIVATGIPVAKNAYEKVVITSNAEVLLSTTAYSLRNELGIATEIEIPSGSYSLYDDVNVQHVAQNAIIYYNENRKAYSVIYANPNEDIKLQRYTHYKEIGKNSLIENLIPDRTSTDNMYVTYSGVSFDETNNIITFTGLSARLGDNVLTERDSLSIYVLRR